MSGFLQRKKCPESTLHFKYSVKGSIRRLLVLKASHCMLPPAGREGWPALGALIHSTASSSGTAPLGCWPPRALGLIPSHLSTFSSVLRLLLSEHDIPLCPSSSVLLLLPLLLPPPPLQFWFYLTVFHLS